MRIAKAVFVAARRDVRGMATRPPKVKDTRVQGSGEEIDRTCRDEDGWAAVGAVSSAFLAGQQLYESDGKVSKRMWTCTRQVTRRQTEIAKGRKKVGR